MKKIIAMLLAMAMLLCFAACQSNETETPGSKEPVQDSFTFTYKGTKIALHAPAADVVAALGGLAFVAAFAGVLVYLCVRGRKAGQVSEAGYGR